MPARATQDPALAFPLTAAPGITTILIAAIWATARQLRRLLVCSLAILVSVPILSGLAGLLVGALAGTANAGTIMVKDNTSDTSIGRLNAYAKNVSGASEEFDSYDQFWSGVPPSTYSTNLKPYFKPYTTELETDSHPITTSGWDLYLKVEGGTLTCDNSLKLKVTDATDLSEPIYTYDTLNPSVKYEIPKDGSVYTINLPNLINQPEGGGK